MPRLHVLRHAKSSWADTGLADRERPLAGRGRKATKLLAKHMRAESIDVALVLCSPARRTRETLERLGDAPGAGAQVEIDPALYGADADELMERLRRIPDGISPVMLVGHNPGLQDLVLALAGAGERLDDVAHKFPTGALATLEWPGTGWGSLRPGCAELVAHVTPREL